MSITSWALSIAGIVILSLLTELIMPEGETSKYIKSIFAVFTVYAIVSPLPKLLSSSFSLDSFFSDTAAASVDYGYIDYTNVVRLSYTEKEIARYLSDKGLAVQSVEVFGEFDLIDLKISSIKITVSTDAAQINVTEIAGHVNDLTGVAKENIYVYGK